MQSFWSFAQLLFDWVSDRLLSAEHFCPPETWLPWWIRFFGRWGIYIRISLQDETRSGLFHRAILNHGCHGVCDGFCVSGWDSLSVLVAFRLIHPEHHSQAVLANALDSKSCILCHLIINGIIVDLPLHFSVSHWHGERNWTKNHRPLKKRKWKSVTENHNSCHINQ